VKAADFNAICANSQSEAAAVSLPAPPAPQPDEPVVRYLKCPVCSEIMNRTNYAHASGVIINTCVGHGIWFDHDALRRVIEFIRGGGLDRARKMDELERAHESAMEQCQRRSVRDWYPFSQGGLPHGEEAFRAIASLIDVAVR
jgi:Zn-finger nucleic acid-binding protein